MEQDLTIVLLGNLGVGKSATGNTILGRKAFLSKWAFRSVTREISEESGFVWGKTITVIDTPGILCAGAEDRISKKCEEILQSGRPHLFLVITKIDRFTAEQYQALEAAVRIIGERGLENSYLLFTGGDLLETSLDHFIFEDDESPLPDVVERFRGRFHSFNNEDGGQEPVRELLLNSGHLSNDIYRNSPWEPAHPDARRIVLLGKPGAGKSATGNSILGSDYIFQPVTLRSASASAVVEDRIVTVVDTPGFSDETLSLKKLHKEMMRAITEAVPGPHAFVVVVKFDRFTETNKKLFKLLPIIFGSDTSCHTMVVFTHGDELRRDLRGRSMDEMISSSRILTDLVSMCSGRYCVFDNTATGRRQQVRNLLEKIDKMVADNEGKCFTSDMFEMANNFIREARIQQQPQCIKEARRLAWRRLRAFIQWKFLQNRQLLALYFPCMRQHHSRGPAYVRVLEDSDTEQGEAMNMENLHHD